MSVPSSETTICRSVSTPAGTGPPLLWTGFMIPVQSEFTVSVPLGYGLKAVCLPLALRSSEGLVPVSAPLPEPMEPSTLAPPSFDGESESVGDFRTCDAARPSVAFGDLDLLSGCIVMPLRMMTSHYAGAAFACKKTP